MFHWESICSAGVYCNPLTLYLAIVRYNRQRVVAPPCRTIFVELLAVINLEQYRLSVLSFVHGAFLVVDADRCRLSAQDRLSRHRQ